VETGNPRITISLHSTRPLNPRHRLPKPRNPSPFANRPSAHSAVLPFGRLAVRRPLSHSPTLMFGVPESRCHLSLTHGVTPLYSTRPISQGPKVSLFYLLVFFQ
jgi:hypothetical protein